MKCTKSTPARLRASAAYYYRNQEAIKAKVREYARKKVEARAPYGKRSCEVCGSSKKICFDHNHSTGEFRGWLCNNCNTALGMMGDNPVAITALAEYAKRI